MHDAPGSQPPTGAEQESCSCDQQVAQLRNVYLQNAIFIQQLEREVAAKEAELNQCQLEALTAAAHIIQTQQTNNPAAAQHPKAQSKHPSSAHQQQSQKATARQQHSANSPSLSNVVAAFGKSSPVQLLKHPADLIATTAGAAGIGATAHIQAATAAGTAAPPLQPVSQPSSMDTDANCAVESEPSSPGGGRHMRFSSDTETDAGRREGFGNPAVLVMQDKAHRSSSGNSIFTRSHDIPAGLSGLSALGVQPQPHHGALPVRLSSNSTGALLAAAAHRPIPATAVDTFLQSLTYGSSGSLPSDALTNGDPCSRAAFAGLNTGQFSNPSDALGCICMFPQHGLASPAAFSNLHANNSSLPGSPFGAAAPKGFVFGLQHLDPAAQPAGPAMSPVLGCPELYMHGTASAGAASAAVFGPGKGKQGHKNIGLEQLCTYGMGSPEQLQQQALTSTDKPKHFLQSQVDNIISEDVKAAVKATWDANQSVLVVAKGRHGIFVLDNDGNKKIVDSEKGMVAPSQFEMLSGYQARNWQQSISVPGFLRSNGVPINLGHFCRIAGISTTNKKLL